MSRTLRILLPCLLLAALAVLWLSRPETGEPDPLRATVVAVTDGDTFTAEMADGSREKIRLLLVDTPETKHPTKPVQPFGPEASAYTAGRLKNAQVRLEFDAAERDRYGRLLAYVYLQDGSMLNELLLTEGLARVAVYPPNVKYVDEFRRLQDRARLQRRGIWSMEDYATDRGFDESEAGRNPVTEAAEPQQSAAPKQTAAPGKADSSRPSAADRSPSASSARTVTYANCDAVRAAGAAPLRRGEPGYSRRLDRDGDGVACQ
ncbi:thermonuclease family protein [Paenibacillus spiritus]|nr:thermonuclease family protein [Paenibacillus spiritus]